MYRMPRTTAASMGPRHLSRSSTSPRPRSARLCPVPCLGEIRQRGIRQTVGFLLCAFLLGPGTVAAETGQPIGPIGIVASPDQKLLYVVEAEAERIDVLDVATEKVVRGIACPDRPSGVVVSADGHTLYVTCGGPQGQVCVIESATGEIVATIPVGHTPCGPTLLPGGQRLVVCNRFDHDLSVIDVETRTEVTRVPVIREPVAAAASPDGKWVFVANLLPAGPADAADVAAEVTILDMADLTTSSVRLPNGSSSVRGISVSPDGKYAEVVHILSRYQMPTTQLERGWMNTNAMSIIDVANRCLLNTVLLDDIDQGAANPWGVASTADGKQILVTHAGTHELSVIDAPGLLKKLQDVPKDTEEAKAKGQGDPQDAYGSMTIADVPNDLTFLVGLRDRIPLQKGSLGGLAGNESPMIRGPRGFAQVGSKIFIAVYFSDLLAVVDLTNKSYDRVQTVRLHREVEITSERMTLERMTPEQRGQMAFHDATLCFQSWQSCASCHPDARVDGLNWDLMNDGFGNPKNVRSMLLAHRTPPAMSSGIRPTAEQAVRSGIRHILFAVHPEEIALAIDAYLKALRPVPSPTLADGKLSEAARRGRKLFFSDRIGCATCHPKPLYTDLKKHDVDSRSPYDRQSEFDTPTLIEVWRTAPYLHSGHYGTVRELLDAGKHGNDGGDGEGPTGKELDDLIEFVLSL